MTISFEIRKLIYSKLSEGKHKDGIAKTYNVSLRAVKALHQTKQHVSCTEIVEKVELQLSRSTIRKNLRCICTNMFQELIL